jgi:hypothetical protein
LRVEHHLGGIVFGRRYCDLVVHCAVLHLRFSEYVAKYVSEYFTKYFAQHLT